MQCMMGVVPFRCTQNKFVFWPFKCTSASGLGINTHEYEYLVFPDKCLYSAKSLALRAQETELVIDVIFHSKPLFRA